MKISMGLRLGLALAACSCASMAAAAPTGIVAEASRAVPGGRAVRVMVAQAEIASDINPSNIAVATGGGLLGGMLAASQNASRAKKAETAIEPLRTALGDFDAETLAIDATKTGLSQVSWMQPADLAFGKDSSLLGKSAALDASGAAQVAFIEYSYDLSPDFSSIRVVAKIAFANKVNPAANAAKPETRVFPNRLAYAQNITAVVTLGAPSTDINANVANWSANDAKLARTALTQAFARIAQLLPRILALSAADIAAMNGKDKLKGSAGGFAGRVQDVSADGTLLWAGGFIHVAQLS